MNGEPYEPDPDERVGYFSNDYQKVTTEDAAALAQGLNRAIVEAPRVEGPEPLEEIPLDGVALAANGRETRVFAFRPKLIEVVEALRLGEEIAVCGRRWAPSGRDVGVVGDGLLTRDGPILRGRSATEPREPAAAPLFDNKSAVLLDEKDIPF